MKSLTMFRVTVCGPAQWLQGIGGGGASSGTSKPSGLRAKLAPVAGTQGSHKIRRGSPPMFVLLTSATSITVGNQGCLIVFFGASST